MGAFPSNRLVEGDTEKERKLDAFAGTNDTQAILALTDRFLAYRW
jgi:hypothetical protein